MAWDFHDQLQHVTLAGGGDAYYVYDATGQRMRKVIEKNGGALIEERLYLGGFEIFRRRNTSGTVTLERETLHIMDDKQRIAMVEMRTQGTDPAPPQLIRFQLSNHLGSASLELDHQAQIISYEEYYPYGSTSYQAVRNQTETPKRYRYTGMERDEESGLAYHSARYYLPWLGRWSNTDPIGLKGGINVYAYSNNSPLVFNDLNGSNPGDPSLISSVQFRKSNDKESHYDKDEGVIYLPSDKYSSPINSRLKTHGGYCGDEATALEYQLVRDFDESKINNYRIITDIKGKIYGYQINYVKVSDGKYDSSSHNEYYSGVFTREGKFIEGRQFSPSNGGAVSVLSPIEFIAGGIVAGATTKLLLQLAPRATTAVLGWTAGTNLGEAAFGRSSGVNPLHPGDFGRRLSTDERVSRGVTGVVIGVSAGILARRATLSSTPTTQGVSRVGKTPEQVKAEAMAEAIEKDTKAFMAEGLSETEAREMARYGAQYADELAHVKVAPQGPMGGGYTPHKHAPPWTRRK
jgi:RHS repeat-associated protein